MTNQKHLFKSVEFLPITSKLALSSNPRTTKSIRTITWQKICYTEELKIPINEKQKIGEQEVEVVKRGVRTKEIVPKYRDVHIERDFVLLSFDNHENFYYEGTEASLQAEFTKAFKEVLEKYYDKSTNLESPKKQNTRKSVTKRKN